MLMKIKPIEITNGSLKCHQRKVKNTPKFCVGAIERDNIYSSVLDDFIKTSL